MATLKERYELSVWNDIINNEVSGKTNEEMKVAVIGFSESQSPLHAFNVTVKENTNGEKTLYFDMATKYRKKGELVPNPLSSMLGSERKVKLRIFTEDFTESEDLSHEDLTNSWTDYVIKTSDESSTEYISRYMAKEVFVNELGKNGFNVTLATELENNYGTITELTEKVLEGSGWTIDPTSYSPVETIAEPLYLCILSESLTAQTVLGETPITIDIGETIYPTYSSIIYDRVSEQYVFRDVEEIQFLYKGIDLTFSRADTDDNGVIIDDSHQYNYQCQTEPVYQGSILLTGTPNGGGDSLQGNTIVKGIKSYYDPLTDKYVNEYEVINAASGADVGSIAHKYTETIYNTTSIAVNHLTNTTGFVNNIGWLPTSPDPNAPMATCLPFDFPDVVTYDVHVDFVAERIKFTLVDAADVVAQPGATIKNNKNGAVYAYTVEDYDLITANKLAFDILASSLGITESGTYSFTYTRYIAATETTGFMNYLEMPMSNSGTRIFYNEGPSNEYNRIALELDKVYTVRLKGRIIEKLTRDFVDNENGENIYVGNQPAISITAGIYAPSGGTMVFTPKTNTINLGLTSANINSSTNTSARGYGVSTGPRVGYSGSSSDASARVDAAGYAYAYFKSTATTVATTDRIHLEIKYASNSIGSTHNYYIEDVQFFDYLEDVDGMPIFLGDIPKSDITYVNHYYYNDSNDQQIALSSDDSYYTPIYNEGYQSVRHIETKESNYFNNVNSLAELFETWVKFTVKHQKDGKILHDPNTGNPYKHVKYSQYAPNGDEINYAGFKYGINLAGIKRNADSTMLATKVIVKDNSQEYAIDGMCSIRRAPSNPSGENVIYNFEYYVNQGLIDYTQLLRDTYGLSSGDLGYYTQLKALNDEYMSEANLLQRYEHEIAVAESYIEMYTEAVTTATEELNRQQQTLDGINPDDTSKYEAQKQTVELIQAQLDSFEVLLRNYQNALAQYEAMRDATQERIDIILDEKRALHEIFFKKYSRFVLEGSWVDDTYIDDELYYLDGVKVAQTSGFPQVNYQINVVEVVNIQGLSAYTFDIGSRTYIEDTEFFGWTYVEIPNVGQVKTPYKMQVLVTEKTTNLDDPSKSTIMIQNYKNQFEDMFQKMTNTTQTLVYEGGGFRRAADSISPDGEFAISGMEKALANNSFQIASSTNQSVVWDSGKGIEVIDLNNTSLMTRIVAGGMYMTMDGGRTWINGINGQGINTHHLIAGQIDTSLINLVANGSPIFRWDEQGISAFKYYGGLYDPDGDLSNQYDSTQYVRLTQFGMYGTTDGLALQTELDDATTYDGQIQAIKNNSNFSLTWDGLYMQSQNGAISIDPLDGVQVYDKESMFAQEVLDSYQKVYHWDSTGAPVKYTTSDLIPLVELGKFVDDENGTMIEHGLRLRNKEGYVTLLTDTDGDLWLANILTVGSPSEITIDGAGYWRYLGINGTTLDPSIANTVPVLYAGNPDNELSPFKVYGDGRLVASRADITGSIYAEDGHFSGKLTVGLTSGINGATGFDEGGIESNTAPYTFWSGYDPAVAEMPKFYVTPDGHLYAQDVYFEGDGVFSGELSAASGSFSGFIDALGGRFLSHISFGESESSYVGYNEQGLPFININGELDPVSGLPTIGKFSVDGEGRTYADSLMLSLNEAWVSEIDPNRRYNMNIGGTGPNVFDIFNPSTIIAQEERVFSIQANGSVYIGGTLETSGDLIFDGKLKSPNGTMTIDGRTGDIIVKNPSVDGWGIYGNGDAFFSNITVRGKITTVVFEHEKISSVGGQLLISPSVSLINPISHNLLDEYNYYYDIYSLISNYGKVWKGVDQAIVNILATQINAMVEIITEDLEDGDIRVTSAILIIPIEELEKVTEFKDPVTGEIIYSTLPSGTQIISTSTHANSIKLSVEDASGGNITIIGPTAGAEEQYTILGSLIDSQMPDKARELFGTDLGYGLYTDNAYIAGKLHTPNAGVTNEDYLYLGAAEDSTDARIRFWAGTPAKYIESQIDESGNPVEIPFVVTHDGNMYANSGYFRGQIDAVNSNFEGYLSAAGILIDDPAPDDHFYVTRPTGDDSDNFTPDHYIIDINQYGINIWEGGLNIFSDYYSGWRGEEKTENRNTLYGWDGNTRYWPETDNPWPIFTVLDESTLENHIPRLSMAHNHTWFRDTSNNVISSTRVNPASIHFTDYILGDTSLLDYSRVEEEAWNKESKLEIGQVNIANISKYGVKGKTISFGNNSVEAMTIDVGSNVESTNTTTYGLLTFGASVQVSQEPDGITFTYIGEV